MREVHRTAIVPYPVESMFDLVADIDAYHTFVPGCTESRIEACDAADTDSTAAALPDVLASLGLTQSGHTGRFTTRNRMEPPRLIHMSLVDGPFSELEGEWRFEPLGDAGCKLELAMRFSFSNRMADMMLGPMFELSCNRLVDAFVKRADEIYGQ